MKGNMVLSLHGLHEYALQKRAVCSTVMQGLQNPKPAAFVMNFSGTLILRLINGGLYLYEKEEEE